MEPNLGLVLDPGLDIPLYQQLFDCIAERIRTGAFPPGFRLPPTRLLANELGAHRNTVVRAYSELEQSGFLTSTVGRGTFVRENAKACFTSRAVSLVAPPSTEEVAMPWPTLLSERARAEMVSRFTRGARLAGTSQLINLTHMQPGHDLIPHGLFRRCLEHVLRTMGPRALGYTRNQGVLRLRERIAEDLARQGVPARAEDVVITSGSQQALDILARALVDRDDVVLAQEATYAGAIQVFAAAGARLVGVSSDREGPEITRLRNFDRAKAFYLMPNHCNPTGACMSAERRKALVKWSRQTATPLIEDDYAADLDLDGELSLPSLRALDGDVIYLSTFSKKLIPGLRIGFLLCPSGLTGHLAAIKDSVDLGTSALLQHALAEFMERGYLIAHLERVRSEYRTRRDAAVEALRRHLPSEVKFRVPHRGATIWLELPEGLDPEAVFDEAQRRGVLVSPGTIYQADPSSHVGARGVRIVYGSEALPRVVEGIKRLASAIEALASRRSRVRGEPVDTLGVI